MRYRFHMFCPNCEKTNDEIVRDDRNAPSVSCGDCLMDRVEIVQMKVAKIEEIKK